MGDDKSETMRMMRRIRGWEHAGPEHSQFKYERDDTKLEERDMKKFSKKVFKLIRALRTSATSKLFP